MRDIEFAPLYKDITLNVQGKCTKCVRVYKTPNKFCTICKQLELDIRTISNSVFFFFFLPNYVTNTFPIRINTWEIKLKLKLIMFELFIISKLNEIYIFTILPI